MRCLTVAGLIAGLAVAGPLAAQDAEATDTPTDAPTTAPDAPEAPAADYDAGTVLATVDGTEITLGHVVALRERLPEQYQALPDETLLQGLLDQLVDQVLLAGIASADAADDPLAVRLHLENERRSALASRAVTELAGGEVGDAEIQAAYDELVADFEPQTEYNASHIIVATEEEAAALKDEIEAGGDFGELAQEHSTDAAAAQGGSLGWFGPGQMVPEFEAAVQEMETGEVAGPLETQFGWHLVRLEDTRETSAPSLDEVREQIAAELRQEKLMAEIERLRSEAEIERPETGVPASAVRDDAVLAE